MVWAKASAPGKVILFGEHFVVEDQPAIAIALNLRARVYAEVREKEGIEVYSKNLSLREVFPKEDPKSPLYPIYYAAKSTLSFIGKEKGLYIEVDSEIPPASGMGSSAAVAVATVAAVAASLGFKLDREDISMLAYRAEKIVHGKPSGIDNTISTYGGAIAYRKSEGFLQLEADFSPVMLVLADSGIPRNTGIMVAKVQELRKKYQKIMDPLYYAAGRLAVEAAKMMERGDFEAVGELMMINHGLLSAIGVSNMKLEELVYTARKVGALGAKITGAGGGGFIVALCRRGEEKKVAKELEKVSERVFISDISVEGVIIEDFS